MSLAVGDKLGPYEILGRLGAGGMGEVFRGRDTRLEREVAIKVLPPGVAHDPDALRRLEREARVIAALNHSNLLTIFDVGTLPSSTLAGGAPYLVSELLEGKTLRQELASGALPIARATDYAIQIARGLAAAHAKGIIHRDLKPENLFCCEDGRIKVLDFGLAKIEAPVIGDGEERTALEPGLHMAPATAAGIVLGTIGYMAPEQARGRVADARADIFSLGAVLYEMLIGRRAFGGDSSADVISAILREEPPEMVGSGRPVAPALERIVRHCLEKEPARRFQSCSDIAFQLENLSVNGSGITASGFSPVSGVGSGMGSSVGSSAGLPPGAAAGARTGARRLGMGLACVAGVGIVAATWFGARAGSKPTALVISRLTYRQGILRDARLLPEGQGFIALARWNQDAAPSLVSGHLDSPGLQQLDGEADDLEAVARDGELALLQHLVQSDNGVPMGTLARMPLSGGAPRPVMDDIECADWRTGDLGRDAAIARFHPANLETTVEYPVGHVLYRSSSEITDLRLSPDAQRLAFIEHPTVGDDRGHVAVVGVGGGAKRDLTGNFASAGGLAWAAKGNEIWFTAADRMVRALRAVDLSGHARVLMQDVNDLELFDVDSAGRALLSSNDRRYMVKLITPTRPEPTDISVLDGSIYVSLSADGKQVAVGDEDEGTNYSTFLEDTAGSAPVRLGDGEPMAISPDGQWVVSLLPNAPRQLLLLPTGVGQPRPLTPTPIAAVPGEGWLSDSRSLVVIGNLPGKPLRSFWIDLAGKVTPVTPEGTYGNTVTPDGSGVLAVTGDGAHQTAAVYPLRGGAPTPVPGWRADEYPLRFASGGENAGELFVERLPAPGSAEAAQTAAEIYRLNLRTGARQLLTTLPWPDRAGIVPGVGTLDISADGKTIAFGYERILSTLCLVTALR